MAKRPLFTTKDDDILAEGSPVSVEPNDSATVTQTLPAVKVWGRTQASVVRGEARPPIAETGMIARVMLPPEGSDHSDRQDAVRTAAETRAIAAHQRELDKMSKPSALIVEDTTELAEVIEGALRRMNMVTARESRGSKALSRFTEMLPDLILLDLGLPDITGWKVLDSIKEFAKQDGAKVPTVIVITAMDDAANRVVGKLHGVHTYLIKPFTVSQLEAAVRMALGMDVNTSA